MILKRLSEEPLKPWKTPVLFPATLKPECAKRLIVEVGPGRGDFLYHLAESHPEGLVAAIEIKRKRIDRLFHRLQNRGIENVMLIQSDARWALPRFFKIGSIDQIHINFPDPWPKNRHEKNRLMCEEFLAECASRLKTGGHLFFATDQEWYAQDVREIVQDIDSFSSCFDEGIRINPPGAFPTLFMQKWATAGRTLYYQRYYKIT